MFIHISAIQTIHNKKKKKIPTTAATHFSYHDKAMACLAYHPAGREGRMHAQHPAQAAPAASEQHLWVTHAHGAGGRRGRLTAGLPRTGPGVGGRALQMGLTPREARGRRDLPHNKCREGGRGVVCLAGLSLLHSHMLAHSHASQGKYTSLLEIGNEPLDTPACLQSTDSCTLQADTHPDAVNGTPGCFPPTQAAKSAESPPQHWV